MTRLSFLLAIALAALVALSVLLLIWMPRIEVADLPEKPPPPQRLKPVNVRIGPGVALATELRAGTSDSYAIALRSGDFLHLVVEQRGIDLVASLFDPAGRKLLEVDSPIGKEGPEPVFAVAPRAGRYRLEVRAFRAGDAGHYELRIAELRPATDRDRTLAAASAAYWRGEALRARGDPGALRRARNAYAAARRAWRALGQVRHEVLALRRLGQASSALRDFQAASRSYEEALVLALEIGDAREGVRLLNELGAIYRSAFDPDRAERAYLHSLHLSRACGDRRGEATALNDLGALHDQQGKPQSALDAYSQALSIWRELGDSGREAATLHNLGTLYSLLGRLAESRDVLGRALHQERAAGDRRSEAATLTAIGWVHYLADQPAQALALYEEALRLRHETGDLAGEATTLDRRGTLLREIGNPSAALDSYLRALEICRRACEPSSKSHIQANLAELYESRGDTGRSLAWYKRALRGFREAGDRHAEAHALLGIARIEQSRRNLDLARSQLEEALRIIERLRTDPRSRALRISYRASRHNYYELAIDLLMELHRVRPGQRFDIRALEVSEWARARNLLDEVAEAGASLSRRPLMAEPLNLAQIREQVLDEDTVLLEYALGEERSFLWMVTRSSIESHVLPARAVIEGRARRVHDLLLRSHQRGVRQQASLAAGALGDLLLGPVADRLGSERRLFIVSDGALQLVPFAALFVTAQNGRREPLLVGHEVVHLPSASVLASLRRQASTRRPPPLRIAVIADPVFEAGDERLVQGVPSPAVTAALASRRSAAPGLQRLGRLAHSRREAEAILSLVPAHESLRALDFAAGREIVLSGRLERYRILHFATHGLLHAEHPELSGIVLSLVDPRGRPRDGFLRADEISGLRLPVDLVVLSACRTALGKEMRGEGQMGLPRAFLQAGALRVVVSLWNVHDEGTAELMQRFYGSLLREGLPPGQALRRAQLSMLREPRWQAPYYWAGFTLQGGP